MLNPIIAEAIRKSRGTKICIIGIGGGAGVGKTTLSDFLKSALEGKGKKVILLRLDDFFKPSEERARLGTEWDQSHINLAEARRVLEEIKQGKSEIKKPKYSRAAKKTETEYIDAAGADIVIFEGIYAISGEERLGNFLEFVDLPIFMSAELGDIKKWRFRQESEKPHPRTKEEMERHWDFGILPDLRNNILPSRKNARFIIDVEANHHFKVSLNQG